MTLTPEQAAAVAAEDAAARVLGIAKAAACEEGTAKVAVTLADEYAPNAPIELRNEAATRTAGWLRDMPRGAIASETVTSDVSGRTDAIQYRTTAMNPLRASGGMAILTRYVVRRAV